VSPLYIVFFFLVENFPGFPDGIVGFEMMEKFRAQSVRFGTTVITETISKLDLSSRPFKYWREGTEGDADAFESADAVILATGASAKRLHLPGEDTYWNSGISACAVCDGAVPIFRSVVNDYLCMHTDPETIRFRNKPLAVVGGGDSAAEESTCMNRSSDPVSW
jgi:thioredoxin reductase (NADPH)